MPIPDMSAVLGSSAPPTKDAPYTDAAGNDPDADSDTDQADPQFAADCADIFPKLTPEQCRKLQDLIDDRVAQASGAVDTGGE